MRCPQCGQKECCGADMSPEIERLTAELAECRKDAERYRWIKANSTIEPNDSMWALPYVGNWIDMPDGELNVECKSFDEAVDEAMRVDAKAALAAKGE